MAVEKRMITSILRPQGISILNTCKCLNFQSFVLFRQWKKPLEPLSSLIVTFT